jgi:uroporphyrinogen-III synthase
VKFCPILNRTDELLLDNKKILITKEEGIYRSLQPLAEEGADLIFFPAIKIVPAYNEKEIADLSTEIRNYDYLIFTSQNAVSVFHDIAEKFGLDLSKTKIAVTGKATAEICGEKGFYIHIIPERFSAAGLLERFKNIGAENKKILIPCSSIARDELHKGLAELGARVTMIKIYDTVQNDPAALADKIDLINEVKPDLYVFTSPSNYRNFIAIMNIDDPVEYFGESNICAIGITTEKEIRKSGVSVNIVPAEFSLDGISDAIITFYKSTGNIA